MLRWLVLKVVNSNISLLQKLLKSSFMNNLEDKGEKVRQHVDLLNIEIQELSLQIQSCPRMRQTAVEGEFSNVSRDFTLCGTIFSFIKEKEV